MPYDPSLPTARSYVTQGSFGVMVCCRRCDHTKLADLAAVAAGPKADVPVIHLRFRCSACGSTATWSNCVYIGPGSGSRADG